MNVVLNNMIITDDIEKENLYGLNVGQQFLIMEKKDLSFKEDTYYNIQSAFLTQIIMGSIYMIDGANYNIDPYAYEPDTYEEEENNSIGIEYNTKPFEINFLVLKNNVKIKLKHVDSECDIKENSNDFKTKIFTKFKSMTKKSNVVSDRVISYNNNTVEFFMLYPINDYYIGYYMYNNVKAEKYYWKHNQEIYLIDKDFTKSISIEVYDNKNFIDILKDLEPAKYSEAFKEFYEIYYPGNKIDISDYINDPAKIEVVLKAFECSCVKSSFIYDVFNPIYQDNTIEFKGYLDSRFTNSFFSNSSIIQEYNRDKGGYMYDPESLTSIAIRKTKNIKKSLRKELPIDVCTGEYFEDFNYNELYKDAGGLIIDIMPKDKNYNGHSFNYFTLIDGVYCESNENEQKEINNRKKIVEALTS